MTLRTRVNCPQIINVSPLARKSQFAAVGVFIATQCIICYLRWAILNLSRGGEETLAGPYVTM